MSLPRRSRINRSDSAAGGRRIINSPGGNTDDSWENSLERDNMKEQQGVPRQFPKVRRATATAEEISARQMMSHPANPHRVGHYAGLHPEDQPYHSGEVMPRKPSSPRA